MSKMVSANAVHALGLDQEMIVRMRHTIYMLEQQFGVESMQRLRMASILSLLAAIVTAALPCAAVAQSWPDKNITLIIPFPAGGSTDGIGRPIASMLSKKLGKQVIVENRGGAAGNIAAAVVARAAPDGYTLLLTSTGPAATNKLLYKNLSFDPAVDFTPIAMIGIIPQVLIATPKLPVSNVQQLVDFAKTKADLSVGNSGNGTMAHIAAVSLARAANIHLNHVPYRGSAQLITDVLGGQMEAGFPGFVPQVEQTKMLAVSSSERLKTLPNVPTLKESGYDLVAGTWFGIMGPAKMPAYIVETINTLISEFVDTQEAQQLFLTLGMQAIRGTPEDMRAFMAAELARWEPVVRAGNITLE